MLSCHRFRLLQVSFGQSEGYDQLAFQHCQLTHLGVLELLLDISDSSLTHFTTKSPTDQFWPDLTRSRDCSGDTVELTNSVHSHVSNTRGDWQVVECDIEFSNLEWGG